MAQQTADLGGWAEQGHHRRAGSAPSVSGRCPPSICAGSR